MIAYNIISALPQITALFVRVNWKSVALPLIWFGIIVLTLYIEGQTADLIAIWFAPSALTALIMSFFKLSLKWQLAAFVGMTLVGLLISFFVIRPIMEKRYRIERTNVDGLTGKIAFVEEDIDNDAPSGVVRINGQLWTARMEEADLSVAKGAWVEIVRVDGNKLICRPKT
ncbi:MAG: NfeD family protein [Clostridia bacterium]|nr:NfeD family protein [Clostridia bacterium]